MKQEIYHLEERSFIHDLAGTLAVCFLLVDSIEETAPSQELVLLKAALSKLETAIRTRRELLITQKKSGNHE